MTDESTQWIDITTLKLWNKNPNQGDVGKIYESIKLHGYNDTCHIWNGIVKAGNHSVMALTNLRSDGWHPSKCKIPSKCLKVVGDAWYISMIDISDMDEMQSNAFGLDINNIQRSGMDDPAAMAAILQDIATNDKALFEKMSITGDELDELLADLAGDIEPAPDPGAQIDRAAELQEKWQVQRGDVWEIPSQSVKHKTGMIGGKVWCANCSKWHVVS